MIIIAFNKQATIISHLDFCNSLGNLPASYLIPLQSVFLTITIYIRKITFIMLLSYSRTLNNTLLYRIKSKSFCLSLKTLWYQLNRVLAASKSLCMLLSDLGLIDLTSIRKPSLTTPSLIVPLFYNHTALLSDLHLL